MVAFSFLGLKQNQNQNKATTTEEGRKRGGGGGRREGKRKEWEGKEIGSHILFSNDLDSLAF